MHYRFLGNTGLKVSVFSMGSWLTFDKLSIDEIKKLLQLAYDHGINLFDTAEVYGEGRVEDKLGTALQTLSLPREKFMICSKVFWGGSSPTEMGLTRKHIIEACHKSLKRLKTDYIDFYLCHRPDCNTPIEETIIAMNILIQQGKILYWGTSEWSNELIMEAFVKARSMNLIPPSTEQFEYNMFCHDKGDIEFPLLKDKIGIGALVTMPLACGILAGRYNMSIPEDSRAKLTTQKNFQHMLNTQQGKEKIAVALKLEHIAKELNISLAQLGLLWCLKNRTISSIILGAQRVDHLSQNLLTLEMTTELLTPQIMGLIDEIIGRRPFEMNEPTYAEVIAES